MATCPKGHTSAATDYCDECGAPMVAPAQPSSPESPPAPSAIDEPCPECGATRAGRFCEVCGHDFLAAPSPASPNPAAPGQRNQPADSAGDPPADVLPAPPSTSDPAPVEWRVVAVSDRAYYERMRDAGDPDGEAVPFPAFCPERRFTLRGGQVLIGRNSRSRGIEPAIDLTGPPEDAGVSHMHALLVAGPDGSWSIVDLDSANGTYLNDSTDQLTPNQPVRLSPGDRIHVGAWTTLTITT